MKRAPTLTKRERKAQRTWPYLRYSNSVGVLRDLGASETDLAVFDREMRAAAVCPDHGPIEDPILCSARADHSLALVQGGPAGMTLAIYCPWCSSPEMLEEWEVEGALAAWRSLGQ